MIVSGTQQSDSVIHVYVSILPKTPLPSRLSHNVEQSSMCYTDSFIVLFHIQNNPTRKLTVLFHFIDEKTEADIKK